MKYTVVWKRWAEDGLASLWNETADRRGVSRAADTIDRLLGDDPLDEGESRKGTIRILVEPPLGVYYHVSEDDRIVSILRVWEIKPRP